MLSTSNVIENHGDSKRKNSKMTKCTIGINWLTNDKTGDEESDNNIKEESRLGFDDNNTDDEKYLEMTEQELC